MTPSQVARLWALPILLFMEVLVMTSSMQVMEITGSMVITIIGIGTITE